MAWIEAAYPAETNGEEYERHVTGADEWRDVIVIKRSMGHGYAGIDNELYTDPKTGMFFSDAKSGLAEIVAAVKALVPN